MHSLITAVEKKQQKPQLVKVRSGDTVRVHQRIEEGGKTRVQVFEGLVIRTKRRGSLTNSITVRRVASGVGVEKSFMLHSPLIEKVEIVKRSKVRRNHLGYMRARSGKRAKLASVAFDREVVNFIPDPEAETKETPEEVEKAAKEAGMDADKKDESQKEGNEAGKKPEGDNTKSPDDSDAEKEEAAKNE